MTDPRRGRRWQRVKDAAFKRDSTKIVRYQDGTVKVGAPCWICGEPIDYAARPQTPYAYEPDHIRSVEKFPQLCYDLANIAPSHSKCNRSRGMGGARVKRENGLGSTSRDWSKGISAGKQG